MNCPKCTAPMIREGRTEEGAFVWKCDLCHHCEIVGGSKRRPSGGTQDIEELIAQNRSEYDTGRPVPHTREGNRSRTCYIYADATTATHDGHNLVITPPAEEEIRRTHLQRMYNEAKLRRALGAIDGLRLVSIPSCGDVLLPQQFAWDPKDFGPEPSPIDGKGDSVAALTRLEAIANYHRSNLDRLDKLLRDSSVGLVVSQHRY